MLFGNFETRGLLPKREIRGAPAILPRVMPMRSAGLAQIEDAREASEPEIRDGYLYKDGVAVIHAVGPLLKYPSFFLPSSYLGIAHAAEQVAKDDEVHSALFIVDSPGGEAAGLESARDGLRELSRTKRVHGHASDGAYSAGYWLLSQADTVTINETGYLGSIGVYSALTDVSKALANFGIEIHVVSTGGIKGMGADGKVTDEMLAKVKDIVMRTADDFAADVAFGRGMDEAKVRELMTGDIWPADEAVKLGLADAVMPVGKVLKMLTAGEFFTPAPARDDENPERDDNDMNAPSEARQKKAGAPLDTTQSHTLDMGVSVSDTQPGEAMDPEKIKAWMQTPEGSKFMGGIVQEGVKAELDAKVKSGELITRESHTAELTEKEKKLKADGEAALKLSESVDEIHAIDKTVPKDAIKAELSKHEAGPIRDAHIERMKAVAERNAMKNTSAPKDDSPKAFNASANEDVEAHFDRLVEEGRMAEPANKQERAVKLEKFKKQRAALLAG